MIEDFIKQNASWKVVALSLVFYGVLLWLPPNLAYVLGPKKGSGMRYTIESKWIS